jgi:hypothetical protein
MKELDMRNTKPPPIPLHRSNLEGVSITVKQYDDNLAFDGRGDHALEDWFWEIKITNVCHPFCTVKGYWGVYVARSTQAMDLQFNTSDDTSVLQLWPEDTLNEFIVDEGSFEQQTGICLHTHLLRPSVGTLHMIRGLHMYHCT